MSRFVEPKTTKNQRRRIVSFPRPTLTGRARVLNRIVLSRALSSFTDIRRMSFTRENRARHVTDKQHKITVSRTKKQKYPGGVLSTLLSFSLVSSWHLARRGSSYRPSSSVTVVSFSPSNDRLASLFRHVHHTTFSLAHVHTHTHTHAYDDIRRSFRSPCA